MTFYTLLYYNVRYYREVYKYIYVCMYNIIMHSPWRECFFTDGKVIDSRLRNFKEQRGIGYRELTPRGKK